jgi:hypothetical protein
VNLRRVSQLGGLLGRPDLKHGLIVEIKEVEAFWRMFNQPEAWLKVATQQIAGKV